MTIKNTFMNYFFKKLVALSLILFIVLMNQACEVGGADKIPPKLVSTNLSKNEPLSSVSAIILVFSEPLKKDTIAKNLILKYANSKPVELEKYYIKYDKSTKISIGFLDNKLKNTTGTYSLEIKYLEDLAGNKLKNSKNLTINFIDNLAPTFIKKNIDANELKLEFSEPIDPNSVIANKTICITKQSSYICGKKHDGVDTRLDASKYSIETKDNIIKITMNDASIGKKTQAYKIYLSTKVGNKIYDIKDFAGNRLNKRRKVIESIIFYEKIAPIFTGTNLSDNKFDTQSILELNFSEPLLESSIKSENFILKQGTKIIDNRKYKVFYDKNRSNRQNLNKIFFKITAEDLQNSNKNYSLEFQNIKDRAKNPSAFTSINLIFVDKIQPKYSQSNIFDNNLLAGTKKLILLFSEKLSTASLTKVIVKKDTVPINSGLTKKLSTDKKSIIINFATDLDANATYNLELTTGIEDLSGNKLKEIYRLNFKVLDKTKVLFAKVDGATILSATFDGTSWKKALSLQTGIDSLYADANKEFLLVASGTYKPLDKTQAFILKDGVKVYGGFDSSNPYSLRDLTSSILDAKLDENQQSHQLLLGENLSATSVFDGFLLKNAKNTYEKHKGGAVYLKNSKPKLSNLTFINNYSDGQKIVKWADGANGTKLHYFSKDEINGSGGGAIYNHNSSPLIDKCIFIDNSSSYYGGAIFNSQGSNPKITNSEFIGNYASERGGAIFDQGGKAQITSIKNSYFAKNISENCFKVSDPKKQKCNYFLDISRPMFGVGGAIATINTHIFIENSTFIENRSKFARTMGAAGGALHFIASDFKLNKNLFKENQAVYGGSIYNINSTGTIANSTFFKNQALVLGNIKGEGGAVFNRNSSPAIVNSTFVNNSGAYGGAIFNDLNSNPKIYNSILWNNIQSKHYEYINGFIYPKDAAINNIFSRTKSQADLQNTIINPLSLLEDYIYLDPQASKANKVLNPKFAPYNSTSTHFNLIASSPAINKGSDSLYTTTLNIADISTEKDQIDKMRKVGANIDMGAVETQN